MSNQTSGSRFNPFSLIFLNPRKRRRKPNGFRLGLIFHFFLNIFYLASNPSPSHAIETIGDANCSAPSVALEDLTRPWPAAEQSSSEALEQLLSLARGDQEVQDLLSQLVRRYRLNSVNEIFTGTPPLIAICTPTDLQTGNTFFFTRPQEALASVYPPFVEAPTEPEIAELIRNHFENHQEALATHRSIRVAQRPRGCLRPDTTVLGAYAQLVERAYRLTHYDPFQRTDTLRFSTEDDFASERLLAPHSGLDAQIAKVRAERRLIARSTQQGQVTGLSEISMMQLDSPIYAYFDRAGNVTQREGLVRYLSENYYTNAYRREFTQLVREQLRNTLRLIDFLDQDQRAYATEGTEGGSARQRTYYQALLSSIEHEVQRLHGVRCELLRRYATLIDPPLLQSASSRSCEGVAAPMLPRAESAAIETTPSAPPSNAPAPAPVAAAPAPVAAAPAPVAAAPAPVAAAPVPVAAAPAPVAAAPAPVAASAPEAAPAPVAAAPAPVAAAPAPVAAAPAPVAAAPAPEAPPQSQTETYACSQIAAQNLNLDFGPIAISAHHGRSACTIMISGLSTPNVSQSRQSGRSRRSRSSTDGAVLSRSMALSTRGILQLQHSAPGRGNQGGRGWVFFPHRQEPSVTIHPDHIQVSLTQSDRFCLSRTTGEFLPGCGTLQIRDGAGPDGVRIQSASSFLLDYGFGNETGAYINRHRSSVVYAGGRECRIRNNEFWDYSQPREPTLRFSPDATGDARFETYLRNHRSCRRLF
jgi:hypothetical protein